MITNITDNPFRILGVFTNATLKAITASKGKMAAFAKVGKVMVLPTDMSCILPAPNRSVEYIDSALSRINLPIDKIKHALFWFINTSPMDEVAINHLLSENYEKAADIFSMKKCYSSLLNRGVLAFLQEDMETAIENITELIHEDEYRVSFVEAICGSTFVISEENLAKLFINELLNSISASELLLVFTDSGKSGDDDDYIKNIVVEEPISLINREIEKAKNCKDSASEEYNTGVKLINNTKVALKQLRDNLSLTDLKYQAIVDALARQVLQCGINYFNASDDDDDAVEKAMALQQYSLDIAVSKLLKDRCQENVDTLYNQRDTHKIRKELGRLTDLIKRFSGDNNDATSALLQRLGGLGNIFGKSVSEIEHFVKECKIELVSISNKMGVNSEYYINFSDMVAAVALNKLIDSINKAQSMQTSKDDLNNKIANAILVMNEIGELCLKPNTKIFFQKNKETLDGIYKKLNPSFFEENTGCVVWIIIGLIVAIVASLS